MIRQIGKRSGTVAGTETRAIEQILMLSCLFSLGLTAFRMLYTGTWTFVFLVWNLFLAIVPYLVSRKLKGFAAGRPTAINYFRLVIWLLFIPNTFYIVTDLFHLDMNADIPLWYDLLLLFSFAWNGLLLGVASVRHVEKFVDLYWKPRRSLSFVYPIMFLNALGVYIGRYLRFNSWDVITNPFHLAEDIRFMLVHPVRNRLDWCMVIGYSVFMTLIYYSVKAVRKTGAGE